MKQSIDISLDAPPRRFNGWGIFIAVIATLGLTFFLLGPLLEKNAYLGALDDLDNDTRLSRGLLTLCKTQTHHDKLNAKLATMTLPQRVKVAQIAASIDCLGVLATSTRAELLLHGQPGATGSAVVALGPDAIEPAITALEAPEASVRARAVQALVGLADTLNQDRRVRIRARFGTLEPAQASLLTSVLGLAPARKSSPVVPAPETPVAPTAEDPPPTQPTEPSDPEPIPSEPAPPEPLEEAQTQDDGPQLGRGQFRLQLDAFGSTPEPSDPEPASPAAETEDTQAATP